jgi:hypothetical protein
VRRSCFVLPYFLSDLHLVCAHPARESPAFIGNWIIRRLIPTNDVDYGRASRRRKTFHRACRRKADGRLLNLNLRFDPVVELI